MNCIPYRNYNSLLDVLRTREPRQNRYNMPHPHTIDIFIAIVHYTVTFL